MPTDPADWLPDPPTVSPTHGVPARDDQPWWRLQPGRRGQDGQMLQPSVVHGGTCADWPAGRHPPGWTFHTRAEVKRLLDRPDEVVPCEKCRPRVGL
jgi:Family of unknown function (DUF6233)